MDNRFFEKPILNSPYEYPTQHWELDDQGQPTQEIVPSRRKADFITPIPKPNKQKASADQKEMVLDEGKGLSTSDQQYDPTSIINELRKLVDEWRARPNSNDWNVTPELRDCLSIGVIMNLATYDRSFVRLRRWKPPFGLRRLRPNPARPESSLSTT